MESIFEHKILKIHLKSPISYDIGKNILSIYNKNVKIPVLSKYIIDPNHDLGITFVNYAKNLERLNLLYLFSSRLDNINNCGVRLKLIGEGIEKSITYKDLSLFIFNENGGIELVNNPPYSEFHYIGKLSNNENIINDPEKYSKSDIMLFSSTSNLENNINLYNNIEKIFPDYSIKNIEIAVENSKHSYNYDKQDYISPFNIYGYTNDNNEFILFIRINHYYDIDRNIVKNYLIDIFININKTFIYRLENIISTNIQYENKLIYSDITEHKNNYYLQTVDDKIDKDIRDTIQSINRLPGINGNYLIPDKIELQEPDKYTEFFEAEINLIIHEINNHFKNLPYNIKS